MSALMIVGVAISLKEKESGGSHALEIRMNVCLTDERVGESVRVRVRESSLDKWESVSCLITYSFNKNIGCF